MNSAEQIFRPIIVDSPVEFIILGPIYGRLQVMIKSKNAGIDLIGFSQREQVGVKTGTFSELQPQVVKSDLFPQARIRNYLGIEDFDFRKSNYQFIWRGIKGNKFDNKISDQFNYILPDLLEGFEKNDLTIIEWSVAPIISLCVESIALQKKNKRTFNAVIILYSLIILIAVIAGIISKLGK